MNVQNARDSLADYVLKAPSAGTVAAVNGQVGDYASGGGGGSTSSSSSSTSTSTSSSSGFISLTNLSNLQVKAGFGETDAAKLRLGQPATVTLAALSNMKLAAHVISIDTNSTTVNNVVTYYVTFELDNAASNVKPGMTELISALPQDLTDPDEEKSHKRNLFERLFSPLGEAMVVLYDDAIQALNIIGSAVRCSHHTNAASRRQPPISAASGDGFIQPTVGPSISP